MPPPESSIHPTRSSCGALSDGYPFCPRSRENRSVYCARRWIIGLFARILWLARLRVANNSDHLDGISLSLSFSLSFSLSLLVIFEDSCESLPRGTMMMDIRLIFTIIREIPLWIWTRRGEGGRGACKLDYRGDSKRRERERALSYISTCFCFPRCFICWSRLRWIRAIWIIWEDGWYGNGFFIYLCRS